MVRPLLLRLASLLPLIFVASVSTSVARNGAVALANGNCTGLLSPHDFDGAIDSADGGYGAEASISVGSAAFCIQNSTTPNHISAWVAVGGAGSCSDGVDQDLAQAGYRKTQGVSYWLDFAEYDDCSGAANEKSFGSSLPNGTNTKYQVYYNTTWDEEEMNIGNGTYTYLTPFNPYVSWNTPWSEYWSGEVFDGGDEMPGTSSSPANFTSVEYQPSTTLYWSTPSASHVTQYTTQGNFAWAIAPNFNIWHS